MTEQELITVFTPTADETKFVASKFRQVPKQIVLMIQLKLLQRLGSFMALADVPPPIAEHISRKLGTRSLGKGDFARYDQSGSKSLHQKMLRAFLDIKPFEGGNHAWLKEVALQASTTNIH